MVEEQNGKTEAEIKTEVVAKDKQRQHSAEYKLRILRELDECKGTGMADALLRREGLYSSLAYSKVHLCQDVPAPYVEARSTMDCLTTFKCPDT